MEEDSILEQEERNRLNTKSKISEFKRIISPYQGHWEWNVTVIFYEALHLVSALLIRKHKKKTYNHVGRKQNLKKYFPNIWEYYTRLYDQSIIARYTPELGDERLITEAKSHFSNIVAILNRISY